MATTVYKPVHAAKKNSKIYDDVTATIKGVTAYLQWVEYQKNLFNVWNSIPQHQEIATVN